MVEDETEFRDLISQTLESNGVLGKIKAELRASIFLALEDQDKFMASQQRTPKRQELREFLQTSEGRQAFGLVRDLFEYFQLEHTLAVLRPEAGLLDESTWGSLPMEPPPAAARSKVNRPYLTSWLTGAHAATDRLSGASALDAKSSGSNVSIGSHRQSRSQLQQLPKQQQQAKPHQQVYGRLRYPAYRSPSSSSVDGAKSRRQQQQHHDDLLPMSPGAARSGYSFGNSNNNNSSSLGSPTSKRPTHLSELDQHQQHTRPTPSSGVLGDNLDPLSSPRRQQSELSTAASSIGGGEGERPRSRGNNFDDLPPLGGGGGGRARQSPRGGDNSSNNSMLSDQLASAEGGGGGGGGVGGGDYFDDFEDSIAGGLSSSAGGGGAPASARSLKSQLSDVAADVEDEEIDVEELPSAADEDPTDVTVDSELSLQADYVEDAARQTARSQF